jgi:hypothetical protein
MKAKHPLHGLIAATHTPFRTDGSLALEIVEQQARHLLRMGFTRHSLAEPRASTVPSPSMSVAH